MLFLTKFIGKFACDFATLIREKMVYFARVALSVFRMVTLSENTVMNKF